MNLSVKYSSVSGRSSVTSIYAVRCTIVMTMIAAVAAILHLSHYSPSKFRSTILPIRTIKGVRTNFIMFVTSRIIEPQAILFQLVLIDVMRGFVLGKMSKKLFGSNGVS